MSDQTLLRKNKSSQKLRTFKSLSDFMLNIAKNRRVFWIEILLHVGAAVEECEKTRP